MSQADLDVIKTVAQILALAIGGAAGVLWTLRTGFFTLQKRTVETLKETVAALDGRVVQLEEKIQEYEQRNSELEGMVEGKDRAIAEIIAGVAKSGLCASAWDCERRVIPVEKPRRKTHAESAVG